MLTILPVIGEVIFQINTQNIAFKAVEVSLASTEVCMKPHLHFTDYDDMSGARGVAGGLDPFH